MSPQSQSKKAKEKRKTDADFLIFYPFSRGFPPLLFWNYLGEYYNILKFILFWFAHEMLSGHFLKNLTKSSSYRILNRMTHGLYLIRSVIVVSNNSEKFTWEIKLFKKRT